MTSSSTELFRVAEMANLINGFPFDAAGFSADGEVPLVRIRDLSSSEFETFVRREVVPRHAYVQDGDVLIGMDGDFNAVLWKRGAAALNQRVCALRAREGVDARYLAYALPPHLARINVLTWSTTVKHLSAGSVRAIRVPKWPLREQRAIADYLDRETAQIDAFIAKNEELIALLEERHATAVMSAVTAGLDSAAEVKLSGSPWIGRVPEHWQVLQLRHLLSGIDQGVSPQADAGLAGEGQWGVLKSGCVNGGIFRPQEHKALPADFPIDPMIAVKAGDLLVNRASGSVSLLGSAGIVRANPFNLILSDKTFRLLPNRRMHAEYLYWWLNSRSYREQIAATVSGADGLANNLPMSTLRGFVMPLPTLSEQAEIVRHLNAVAASAGQAIQAARRAIDLARERRAALISAAVTGKIDLGVAA